MVKNSKCQANVRVMLLRFQEKQITLQRGTEIQHIDVRSGNGTAA